LEKYDQNAAFQSNIGELDALRLRLLAGVEPQRVPGIARTPAASSSLIFKNANLRSVDVRSAARQRLDARQSKLEASNCCAGAVLECAESLGLGTNIRDLTPLADSSQSTLASLRPELRT
jgi:hypothetical protein